MRLNQMPYHELQRRIIMAADPNRHAELKNAPIPKGAFYDVHFFGGNCKEQSRVWSKKYLESWLSRHDIAFNVEGDVFIEIPSAVGHKYIEYHPE